MHMKIITGKLNDSDITVKLDDSNYPILILQSDQEHVIALNYEEFDQIVAFVNEVRSKKEEKRDE